jgi:hemolysin III
MHLFDVREPINAWSHGAAMLLALPVTWAFWKRSRQGGAYGSMESWESAGSTQFHRVKAVCLLVFGTCLVVCYGLSAVFHAAAVDGETLDRLRRLDQMGIYLLIAGTYTPAVWALMRGSWLWATLTMIWTVAALFSLRVWCGTAQPIWLATLQYLAMGWGAVLCYHELTRNHSHRTLLPLPLGGVFYSAGALLNVANWPVVSPGIFAAHELFHFFTIAGSSCHIYFMFNVVIPAPGPTRVSAPVPWGPWPARFLAWARANVSRVLRGSQEWVADAHYHGGQSRGASRGPEPPASGLAALEDIAKPLTDPHDDGQPAVCRAS